MSYTPSEKTDTEHLVSFFGASQNFFIRIRQAPNHNDTMDISTVANTDDADQLDPLRVPEVIIVICVLLLWCVSIFIFIRHSDILRLQHRDLPFRSTIVNKPMSLDQVALVTRTSDIALRSKSFVSSLGGLTPPINSQSRNERRQAEIIETISLSISPISRKRRQESSLDINIPSSKHSFEKHDDKEELLTRNTLSTGIKQDIVDLHRKSMDQIHQKGIDDLSQAKHTTFYSINDMTNRRQNDNHRLDVKKQCVQESPV